MNLFNIIQEIEKVDPEITERLNPRRAAIKNITSFGTKVAAAALPFAMGTMFKKAYGQTPSSVNDVLNFALTLEYLEYEFYLRGTQAPGLIPSGPPATAINVIRDHEDQHVKFLKSVLGAAAVAKPTFDFTAKGTFPTVFVDYNVFLAVSQALEDTGVRAYKGQAPNLIGNQVVLTAALNIHSVEARHASHVRQMRRAIGGAAANMKPWITGANDTGIGAAVNANYAGEDNITQGGVNVTTLAGATPTSSTEAYDEPLTKEAVLELVKPFIVA